MQREKKKKKAGYIYKPHIHQGRDGKTTRAIHQPLYVLTPPFHNGEGNTVSAAETNILYHAASSSSRGIHQAFSTASRTFSSPTFSAPLNASKNFFAQRRVMGGFQRFCLFPLKWRNHFSPRSWRQRPPMFADGGGELVTLSGRFDPWGRVR